MTATTAVLIIGSRSIFFVASSVVVVVIGRPNAAGGGAAKVAARRGWLAKQRNDNATFGGIPFMVALLIILPVAAIMDATMQERIMSHRDTHYTILPRTLLWVESEDRKDLKCVVVVVVVRLPKVE